MQCLFFSECMCLISARCASLGHWGFEYVTFSAKIKTENYNIFYIFYGGGVKIGFFLQNYNESKINLSEQPKKSLKNGNIKKYIEKDTSNNKQVKQTIEIWIPSFIQIFSIRPHSSEMSLPLVIIYSSSFIHPSHLSHMVTLSFLFLLFVINFKKSFWMLSLFIRFMYCNNFCYQFLW